VYRDTGGVCGLEDCRLTEKAGKFTPAAAAGSACTAIAYRGTSGRERGGLGGLVVVLQAYSSDEAGEFSSEKGPIEGLPRRGLGVHRAVVARGARLGAGRWEC